MEVAVTKILNKPIPSFNQDEIAASYYTEPFLISWIRRTKHKKNSHLPEGISRKPLPNYDAEIEFIIDFIVKNSVV